MCIRDRLTGPCQPCDSASALSSPCPSSWRCSESWTTASPAPRPPPDPRHSESRPARTCSSPPGRAHEGSADIPMVPRTNAATPDLAAVARAALDDAAEVGECFGLEQALKRFDGNLSWASFAIIEDLRQ